MLFFVLFLLVKVVSGQQINETYDYPLRPGTEGWRGAKNHDELRRLSQIPSNTIAHMDTRTLLISVTRYPLIGDILVFPSFSRGIERLKENFSAFDSLLRRHDVIEALIWGYGAHDPVSVNELKDPVAIGEHMLASSLLEFTIADLVKHLDIHADQRQQLQAALMSKYRQNEKFVDKFGRIGLSTCLWAANQLAFEAILSEPWYDSFRDNGVVLDGLHLDTLKRQIENFL